MKNTSVILLLSSIVLLISCRNTNQTAAIKHPEGKLVSSTYKEPVFLNDQRISKIKGIESELEQIFIEHSKTKKIPGIAYGIVVDDSLVIASATGLSQIKNNIAASTSTSFRIASMSKSFTAMAILKLRDEQKLSLNDPVSKYIPELGKLEYLTEDSPLIDIENLLTMTAGFPEDNPWGDRQLALSDEAFIDLISKGLSISKVSSSQFEYSNTGYAMLGKIITSISGIPYQEYIKKHIFLPLGMNNTFWEYSNVPQEQLAIGYRWEDETWKKEPMLHDGAYGAMGGLITSIEDFNKYVSFHLSAWPARSDDDTGPIKRSSLREMHTPQFNFLNSWNKDWDNKSCASMIGYGFGLGISMDCKRRKRISHGGALPGFGSNYAFFPEYGIGIMAFGNLTYTTPIPYDTIEKMLFEKLDLQSRKLPASDILEKRKGEIANLFQTGKANLDGKIFAENFFLDTSKEMRIKEIQDVLDSAGGFINVLKISPRNQLRGDFKISCENGDINVFFTLTPEKTPMVQRLDVSFKSRKSE
ncbi:serine hydrolase domain-containing protein [Maribacter sp. HTCC2170]|uniref:serine hydrolase domain-containing protein n=1 Tax=Maribacter sp. (strain HTCC2170 / KCCM 42371) TaxID=313603 RepID=UPI00006AFCC3|nr:serine hydrolase domain-containing protein [Maribacter sp. HTCC2170]